jgi:hypothetical protein
MDELRSDSELNIRGEIKLWPNRRTIAKFFGFIFIIMLLPVFFALLAYFNEGDLRTAFWITCGISFLIIAHILGHNVNFGVLFSRKPAAVLKEYSIAGDDGIEIPIDLIKEIVVVNAYDEKIIGFVMKPGAFEQLAPERVKRIKERCAWFMLKFGFALSYNGLTIPGARVLEILKNKYQFNVRTRKKPMDGP